MAHKGANLGVLDFCNPYWHRRVGAPMTTEPKPAHRIAEQWLGYPVKCIGDRHDPLCKSLTALIESERAAAEKRGEIKERFRLRPMVTDRKWTPTDSERTTECDWCGNIRRIVAWGYPGCFSTCAECVVERGIALGGNEGNGTG